MANKQIHSKKSLIEKANSTIFIVVLIASVIAAASIVGIKVLWDQRGYQNRVITAQEASRDQLEQNLTNAESLRQELVALEASDVDSQLVLDALPSKYDFPALTSSIEKIVALSGGTLESFSGQDQSVEAEPSSSSPEPFEMTFTVTIRGTYENMKKFVSSLERSIRSFRVDNFNLNGSDEKMQGEFTVTTFYQPSTSLEVMTESIQ